MSIGGIIVDEPINCGSAPSSQPGTPRTKVKFSCSYGGKILPRSANGHLKYVGGETRVISVPIDITFQDLMKKLTYLMDGEMILKYQIVPEELETLVTVKTTEDLQLMFEECNRYDNAGTSRLKTFLFPGKPPLVDNGSMEHLPSLEQRYINAINGVVRPSKHQLPINSHFGANIGSPPPKSPEKCPIDILNSETTLGNIRQSGKSGMQRVRSSPSVCSLEKQQEGSLKTSNFHHDYHKHKQQSNYNDHFSKPVLDPRGGGSPQKLMSVRSIGQGERVRYQGDSFPNYLQLPLGYNRYHGGCSKFMQYDECSPYMRRERAGSLPVSPLQRSPRGNHMRRGWETPPPGDY